MFCISKTRSKWEICRALPDNQIIFFFVQNTLSLCRLIRESLAQLVQSTALTGQGSPVRVRHGSQSGCK